MRTRMLFSIRCRFRKCARGPCFVPQAVNQLSKQTQSQIKPRGDGTGINAICNTDSPTADGPATPPAQLSAFHVPPHVTGCAERHSQSLAAGSAQCQPDLRPLQPALPPHAVASHRGSNRDDCDHLCGLVTPIRAGHIVATSADANLLTVMPLRLQTAAHPHLARACSSCGVLRRVARACALAACRGVCAQVLSGIMVRGGFCVGLQRFLSLGG